MEGKTEESQCVKDSGRVLEAGEERWYACWCCQDQQRTCRMEQASVENFEQTRPAKMDIVVSHKQSSWQRRQRYLHQKEKEQSHQSTSPYSEMGEIQGK